jgi:hypothetical protein
MRGAFVSAGSPGLVYSFATRSFQIGLIGSIAWLSLGLPYVLRLAHPLLVACRELPTTSGETGSSTGAKGDIDDRRPGDF